MEIGFCTWAAGWSTDSLACPWLPLSRLENNQFTRGGLIYEGKSGMADEAPGRFRTAVNRHRYGENEIHAPFNAFRAHLFSVSSRLSGFKVRTAPPEAPRQYADRSDVSSRPNSQYLVAYTQRVDELKIVQRGLEPVCKDCVLSRDGDSGEKNGVWSTPCAWVIG